jgi:hypothetical protein
MSWHKQDYVNFFKGLWSKFLKAIGHEPTTPPTP